MFSRTELTFIIVLKYFIYSSSVLSMSSSVEQSLEQNFTHSVSLSCTQSFSNESISIDDKKCKLSVNMVLKKTREPNAIQDCYQVIPQGSWITIITVQFT